METNYRQSFTRRLASSYPTYEEWKRPPDIVIVDYLDLVLILPMRNGNQKRRPFHITFCPRSYPTYEEWKLGVFIDKGGRKKCSYPTYEEWKLPTDFPLNQVSSGFLSYL